MDESPRSNNQLDHKLRTPIWHNAQAINASLAALPIPAQSQYSPDLCASLSFWEILYQLKSAVFENNSPLGRLEA
jgi:hypothetical protein